MPVITLESLIQLARDVLGFRHLLRRCWWVGCGFAAVTTVGRPLESPDVVARDAAPIVFCGSPPPRVRLGQEGAQHLDGDPNVIASGGYRKSLIRATEQYVHALKRCVMEADLREANLQTFVAEQLQAGWITYFAPYEAVHRQNVVRVVEPLAN